MIQVSCHICMGKGFILFRKDNYETKKHCTCRQGEVHKYDGTQCKHSTKYRCASIDELPSGAIDEIIKDNIKRYGLRKVGDRWMVDVDPKLTPEELKDIKRMAWEMMGVKL